MAKYTISGLEQTYNNWRAPTVKLSIASRDLSTYNPRFAVEEAEVETGVGPEAGYCRIALKNIYDRKNSAFLGGDVFCLGSPVQVAMGYVATEPVFSGYIHTIDYGLDGQEGPSLVLHCMDVKAAMMGSPAVPLQSGDTYRQVISGMFSGAHARGYTAICQAPTISLPGVDGPVPFPTLQLDDYAFLTRTAELLGGECFVQKGKLLLRKRPACTSPMLELSPGQVVLGVRASKTSAGYVTGVTVVGSSDDERDAEKKRIKGAADNAAKAAPEGSVGHSLFSARRLVLRAAHLHSDDEAQQLAEAQLRLRQALYCTLEVRSIGLPVLCPGEYLALKRFSPAFNKNMYITAVKHRIGESFFETTTEGRMDA